MIFFRTSSENSIESKDFIGLTNFEQFLQDGAIEVNHPSGRSDWEMLGRPDSAFKDQKTIIEFKYFKKGERNAFEALTEADADDIEQVVGYAADTVAQFPQYRVKTAVLYVCANEGFKLFEVPFSAR